MSDIKGPVIEGKLKGKTELSYIPFSDDGQEKPVLATEQFSLPRAGTPLSAPLPISSIIGGNKPWFAKYIAGTKHTDAPNNLGADSQYLLVGGREYGANTYRGIGYGYVSDSTQIAPVFAGIIEKNTTDNTYGDFVIATRSEAKNIAPTVRMSVTYDGDISAADGYSPTKDLSLTNKKYVDDLIAELQKQIDELKSNENNVQHYRRIPE